MRLVLALSAIVCSASAAVAAEPPRLVLKDHQFSPATITVPANTRVQIRVDNEDKTPDEFDSGDLRVEKLMAPNSSVVINIGPLKPGRYAFEGEFHAKTAKGVVIAEVR